MTDQNTTSPAENQPITETQTAPNPNAAVDTQKPADTGATLETGDTASQAAPATDGELQAFREKLAGGDEAILKQLLRYKSVDAISRGFRESYNAAKSGKKSIQLTEKSSPEEVKAYREANGIPDDPTAYPGDFREGFTPSEADKAILGDFKSAMHEKNVPPAAAKAALEWYEDFAVTQKQQLDGNLAKKAKETQTLLRNEWGGEYDGNLDAAQTLLTTQLGAEGFEAMMGLRLMDGSRLQDNLPFVKMMAQLGADYYGGTAIMTGDVETTSKTVQDRIDELMALRVSDPEKYKSDDVQGKITKLYAQRDKISVRK